jgi:Rrf2 family protein
MSANSRFTITVHVLTLLAQAKAPLSSTYIAGSVNTNPVTIRRVVGELRQAGLVETIPGSAGGAVLRRPPEQITLNDVYQMVKEETFFGLHPSQPNPECPVGRNIQAVLLQVFAETDRQVADWLRSISIADLLTRVVERETVG